MISTRINIITAMVMVIFLSACFSGEVVKITTVQNGTYGGLEEEAIAKLDEIKSRRGKKEINDKLKNVIDETNHFSVAEYLEHYPEARGLAGDDYRVGGYDVINITVYEEEDLSRESIRVARDGYISFPLIGRVMVDGLTTSEIEALISRKLAEGKYLWDAHVSVMVIGYNSKKFLVLGIVKSPGSYALKGRERVLDAISKAGGVGKGRDSTDHVRAGKKGKIVRTLNPDTAQKQKIVINVDIQGLLHGGEQDSNILMQDKDVLYIPTAEHVYIIGQVKNPKSYALPDRELSLVEAISMAGGFTNIAARNRTRIIRVEDGIEKIIEVRVDNITKAGKKIQDVNIKPDDVIVVPLSFF